LYFVYPFKNQATYETFKRLGEEMKILGPACAEADVPQDLEYRPVAFDPLNNVFPDVQVCLKKNPSGGYILLAANQKPYPVEVSYQVSLLAKRRRVKHLFDKTKMCTVKEGNFSDGMQPMDTRAYAIPGPDRLPTPVKIVVQQVAHPEKTDRFYTRLAIPDTGVPGKKNILRNSSFEECSIPGVPDYYYDIRLTGYRFGDPRGDCGFAVDQEHAYDGKQSLRFEVNKAQFLLFGVFPGEDRTVPYTFSAWVRGDGSEGTTIRFYGPVAKRQAYGVTDKWQRISAAVKLSPQMPRGGDLFGFTLRNRKSEKPRYLWLDAIQFEKSDQATEYER